MGQMSEDWKKIKKGMYGASPGPCDRLGCHIESCYGWDYCRQARAVATKEEWKLMVDTLFPTSEEKGDNKDAL